ncbi:MAG TPA: hypothetical protein VMT52_00895 [Planctomycetota bacterium]|nr:hypothetical protein [Planctomycetota bacterium]
MSAPGESLRVLILEPGSPRPEGEIGRIVALHSGVNPSDATMRVRYGGGLLADHLRPGDAEAIARELSEIGVRTRTIEASRWALEPRGFRAFGLELPGAALVVRLVSGRMIVVPKETVFGLHLYALSAPRGDGPGEEVVLAMSRPEERGVLSPRGRDYLCKAAESGLLPFEMYLTIHSDEPFGPIRVRKRDFDFTSLGEKRLEHSADNFLILLEEVLAAFPLAMNREPAERFLTDLDPRAFYYFKEEEAENKDRWILQWRQIKAEERGPPPEDA